MKTKDKVPKWDDLSLEKFMRAVAPRELDVKKYDWHFFEDGKELK